MSMGIYFQAARKTPLTEAEDAKISKITLQYWEECSFKDSFEGPGTFAPGEGQIYCGMIRIPLDIPEENLGAFFSYWLKWLTEITHILYDAEWKVQFEEIPLIWEETGWRFMTDEEYSEIS